MVPSKKDEKTAVTSADTSSQKEEKNAGPNPSGPGLASLFILVKAFLISSGVKGALR
jgi:hypothetical protein